MCEGPAVLAEFGRCARPRRSHSSHRHPQGPGPPLPVLPPLFDICLSQIRVEERDAAFREISRILYEELGDIEAVWAKVQQYQDLWFFPVDNTQAQGDPVIRAVMRTVERVALAEQYITKLVSTSSSFSSTFTLPWDFSALLSVFLIVFFACAQVPGSWVALLAMFIALVGEGTRFTPLDHVRTMAGEVDLAEDHLGLVLHYFNQLGLITWFDDTQLRNLVILVSLSDFHCQWLSDISLSGARLGDPKPDTGDLRL